MSLAIWKSTQATVDLFAVSVYLDLQTTGLGDRFYARAEETFRQLAETLGLGAMREFRSDSTRGIRCWRIREFENWLVFYRMTGDAVEILRVLHGARDLGDLFETESADE